jgi:hypothetical protein
MDVKRPAAANNRRNADAFIVGFLVSLSSLQQGVNLSCRAAILS